MHNVSWPARLQHLTTGALARLLPPQWDLWLDGGHNDSAGEVLAQQLRHWQQQDHRPLYLIFGMLTTKIPAEFLTPLLPYVSAVRTVPITDEPLAQTSQLLAAATIQAGAANVAATNSVIEALQDVTCISDQPARILICGSLYLAGEVLTLNAEG